MAMKTESKQTESKQTEEMLARLQEEALSLRRQSVEMRKELNQITALTTAAKDLLVQEFPDARECGDLYAVAQKVVSMHNKLIETHLENLSRRSRNYPIQPPKVIEVDFNKRLLLANVVAYGPNGNVSVTFELINGETATWTPPATGLAAEKAIVSALRGLDAMFGYESQKPE